jgi:hypothetical protein
MTNRGACLKLTAVSLLVLAATSSPAAADNPVSALTRPVARVVAVIVPPAPAEDQTPPPAPLAHPVKQVVAAVTTTATTVLETAVATVDATVQDITAATQTPVAVPPSPPPAPVASTPSPAPTSPQPAPPAATPTPSTVTPVHTTPSLAGTPSPDPESPAAPPRPTVAGGAVAATPAVAVPETPRAVATPAKPSRITSTRTRRTAPIRQTLQRTYPVAHQPPLAVSSSRSTAAPVALRPAPPSVAGGGRLRPAAAVAAVPGHGFDSPLGRFSVSSSGILIGGSTDGSASVRLVVPSGLVGLAALIAAAAVLGQRRAERRRRVLG